MKKDVCPDYMYDIIGRTSFLIANGAGQIMHKTSWFALSSNI